MASSKEYLEYVLEQLSGLDGVTFRPMMGEYILYYDGKTVGGVYDDRFLLKMTKAAVRLLEENSREVHTDIPYSGAREMIAADIDDRELSCRLIKIISEELPLPKKKRKSRR